MRDSRGTTICTGDLVQVLHVDASRGAAQWMERGEVVGFGRTRARLTFPSYNGVYTVGPECLRVVGSRRTLG